MSGSRRAGQHSAEEPLRDFRFAPNLYGTSGLRVCACGCGVEFDVPAGERMPRKWYSEACRVRAWRARDLGASQQRDRERARLKRRGATGPYSNIDYSSCRFCAATYVLRRPCRPTDSCCRRESCRRAANNQRMRSGGWTKSRRRARRSGQQVEQFKDVEIYERDRWICGICHRRVKRTATFPDPRSPSIDHVIPLSEHGEHLRTNVRCAHLGCNIARGNRGGGEQLRLVG